MGDLRSHPGRGIGRDPTGRRERRGDAGRANRRIGRRSQPFRDERRGRSGAQASRGFPAEAGPDDSGVGPAPLVGGAVAGAAALIALTAYGYRRRRRSRLRPDELVAAELGELERALERLGEPLPPGATLLRAEDRLGARRSPRAELRGDAQGVALPPPAGHLPGSPSEGRCEGRCSRAPSGAPRFASCWRSRPEGRSRADKGG